MQQKETVLILGVGNYQIDAIQYCKDAGYRVISCSCRDDDPGMPLIDGFRLIDLRDAEGITDFARDEHAILVYSIGSDIAVPSIAQASEALGLPHYISTETARICQNKGLMRKALAQTQWSLPFVVTDSLDVAREFQAFPAMMKPVDSQGQRGCYRVDSTEDIERHFADSAGFSSTGDVIIERFVDGPEISVNAFLRGGNLEFFMPSDRYSFSEYPGGIIKEHGLPCRALTENALAKVEQLVKDVTKCIGLSDGPAYFQIKLDGENPHVLEVTPRLDGCNMWRFIKMYCGYDLLAASLDTLLGTPSQQPEPAPREGDWRLTFMSSKPDVPFDRSAYDIEGAEYVQWYYETGDIVARSNGYMEKGGYRIHRIG